MYFDRHSKETVTWIHEDWKPPDDWSDQALWDPQPGETKPSLPEDFILHFWEHPHDALAFALLQKLRHFLQKCHHRFRPRATNRPVDVEMQVSSEAILPNCGPFLISICPKRLHKQLEASTDNPPYGWVFYIEEKFRVPEAISTIFLFLTLLVLLGILVWCLKMAATLGFGILGL